MTDVGTFSASIAALAAGTTYHFRAIADGGAYGTDIGADMSFLTQTPPVVTTVSAAGITGNTENLNGNLTSLGTAPAVNVLFEYGTTTSYGSTSAIQAMTGTGAFNANISGLSSSTAYHFRAIADGGIYGVATGSDMTFTTVATPPPGTTPPTVSTSPAIDLATTSATLNGYLFQLGTATSVSVSFDYGTTIAYGNTTATQSMILNGSFSANVTLLNPATTYHFIAKADGGVNGIIYGTDMTFTTGATPPSVSTSAAGSETSNATLNGNLTSLGTASSVSVSFEYGPDTTYGSTTSMQTMNVTGAFSAGVTGLNPGTTYHFKAKANGGAHGTATGTDLTFTTLAATAPSVSTSAATYVTNSSATLIGNLSSLGTATTVNVSFDYGTTTGYGSTTATQAMTGTGAFIINVTGLTASTLYHFRARSDGGAHGVSTGSDMTFTTLTPPAANTVSSSGITSSGATLSGGLTAMGTATTVNVSFEYGTTTGYGSTTTTQAMTGTGAYSASITGLLPGTTYHFRAKADGGTSGIATGLDMTFTTLVSTSPAVSTSAATNVTYNSITLNGSLTSLGTASTVNVSFEYGTTTTYGSTTAIQLLTNIGVFSADLTGLSPGTIYHFRAKADGGTQGVATGSDMTFITNTPPIVFTSGATSITSNSATLNGNLAYLGTAASVNAYFEYGTTNAYGSTTPAQLVPAIGVFSAGLTGLTPNTTYHFQAIVEGGLNGVANGLEGGR